MGTRVSVDDLRTAAAWLYENDGDDGESEACHRVADWLLNEVERRHLSSVTREVSRRVGRKVSATQVRASLAKKTPLVDAAA